MAYDSENHTGPTGDILGLRSEVEEEDSRSIHRRIMAKESLIRVPAHCQLKTGSQVNKMANIRRPDGLAHVSDEVYSEMLASIRSLHIHLFQLALVYYIPKLN